MKTLASRRIIILLSDSAIVLFAFVFAFLLRFDFRLDSDALQILATTWPLVLTIHLLTAYYFGLYRGIYYFSSFPDLLRIAQSAGLAAVMFAAVVLFARQGKFPRSVLLLHPMLALLGIGAVRFGIRIIKTHGRFRSIPYGGKAVFLIGAGDLGESLLRQILKTPDSGYNVVGFIDDDQAKWGLHIHDVPVLGGRTDLLALIQEHEPEELVITVASQRGDIVRSVMDVLQTLDKKPELRIAPAFDELLRRHGEPVGLREVKPADLLNRSVIKLDEAGIARLLERKTVLISGAGGSIGSELCRQALKYEPEKLVLLESHANSLFEIERELREKAHGAAVVPVLGDTRDIGLVERVFLDHKPQIVLHAAAHKHVHQLEFNVPEGISNNVLGTFRMACAADKHKAEVFLLISTDKAVRPASVMGVTKRAAERVVKSFSGSGRTRFVAVRFGNVLGSSGSVLPIFQDQIAKGGPITVTDESATRYFMIVEEAVSLVLQAASMANGGEVFVLKMGTPVRIMDMAKNLVLLSGLVPGKDIEIKVTGLKQGEKVGEELFEDSTVLVKSAPPDIMVLNPHEAGQEDLRKRVLELELLTRGSDTAAMLRKLQELVPTFKPAEAHGLESSRQ